MLDDALEVLTFLDKDIEGLITDFLTGLQKSLREYLAINNRNATGASSDSIQLDNVTPQGGQLIGSPGIQFVFKGRGPGGFPPISNIIDWCNARGLPRSVAWAVARSIAENGTKLWQAGGSTVNGLTDIITPETIAIFTQSVSDGLAASINSEISGIFNTASFRKSD
jgi:hypothetical protein